MGYYPILEVTTEAGRLNSAAFRRARDLLLRKLTIRIVLLSPLFDPVLIRHAISIVSPVRNYQLRLPQKDHSRSPRALRAARCAT